MSATVAARPSDLLGKARLFTSAATEAFEDGAHKARRAWKRGARGFEDYRDDALHQVRRRPFSSLGAATALGLVMGAAIAWMIGRDRY